VDFPKALVSGLRNRLKGQPPQVLARTELIVNTRRMARRIRDIFDQGPPALLPRVRLLTDLEDLIPGAAIPPAISPLRRRLELTSLISKLIETDPAIAPRASLYDLADSLARLIDEMQGEGVSAETVASLDVSDQSGHWERAKQFLQIAQTYLSTTDQMPDAEARQRQIVLHLTEEWKANTPDHPVIIAGSTGSRGTTSLLMHAVARLPQGALILPGFDADLPTSVWAELDNALMSEDHPQYRFRHLMRQLDLSPSDILAWTDTPPASAARNTLISLSLRPAPVTHAWLKEGPKLKELDKATQDITLLEAPTPRTEALAIAMRLRKAVEDGQTAALITPDRMLTRQVTAALDRWGILPDDSAGTPLHLSPPGRFLRHVATLFTRPLSAEALLTLLKHPLTHSAADRNEHQLNTQLLEMQIRKDGLPFPDFANLMRTGQKVADTLQESKAFLTWLEWISTTFTGKHIKTDLSLSAWVEQHLALAERIANGPFTDQTSELWKQKAGQTAHDLVDQLKQEASHGGHISAADYRDLIGALLATGEVRDRDAPHPGVMIWGTLEARVQGADLVILGGLNDGTWPEAPKPDPWLNRTMRLNAGLLLPERRIGLSAHDYQQAIAAPEVWLTRAIRSDEAETIPSRWLNRLGNLMQGLPQPEAAKSWADMRARGRYWIDQTIALEQINPVDPAARPSPRPPLAARPKALSVTEIKHLIRDPYAIYARHSLRLRPVKPLTLSPDAPLRGTVLHAVMEKFVRSVQASPDLLTKAHLLETADAVLQDQAPWPAARAIWRARIERIADWFIGNEIRRQATAQPIALERGARGQYFFEDLGIKLTGFADRIDLTQDGSAIIYDYKTGTPPSKKEQKTFDKQLLIEAAMVEEGAFQHVGPVPVDKAIFIGLGSKPVEITAPLEDEPPRDVLEGLRGLLANYQALSQGFTARRMVKTEIASGDYDQLARFGEWDGTDLPVPEDLK
jgi:double-strand break repair protein AddB